jgi:hypothetical protein
LHFRANLFIDAEIEDKTNMSLRYALFVSLAIVFLCGTMPAFGTVWTVDDDGPADFSSIQAAIADVGTINGDEIVVQPGVYIESIDFLGKAITLRSASGDPADTIIDGTGSSHVVQCISGEGAGTVLEGFTITGGNSNGNFPDNVGGGMFNDSSSPTVSNCSFSDNTGGTRGGGMYNRLSSPTVNNCSFSGNASGAGGGMYNDSSSPMVSNCSFSGNTAHTRGGGMFNESSSPAVTNCTFSGNKVNLDGGGMYNFNSSPAPVVTNCTFSGNEATYSGGGMYNYNSSPTVTNCILWGDSPDEISTFSSSTLTVRYSDLQGGLPANTVDGGGNIDVDPLFVDADGADNTIGSDDDDLHLLDSSPCIDAGDNAAVPAGISFDLDGNPRFKDSPDSPDTGNGTAPLVDMGPYENMGLCLGDDTSGDSDGDGFCDNIDACPGFDDNGPDSDSDGVPFGCDRCEGFDDSGPDSDGDGEPDACDTCILPGDINCDGIVNLLDLSLLALHWLETI